MDLDRLMDEFAREAGVDPAAPNADGFYEVTVDDMPMSIGAVPPSAPLILWAEIGETPPEGREAFYRMLLEATYGGREMADARFSIDRATGCVLLVREDPAAPEDLADFRGRLDAFADAIAVWRERIADFRAPDDAGAPGGDEGPLGFDPPDFIRI